MPSQTMTETLRRLYSQLWTGWLSLQPT